MSAMKFLESTSQMIPQVTKKNFPDLPAETIDLASRVTANAPKPAATIPSRTLTNRQKRMSNSTPKGFSNAKVIYSNPGL
jgi:hypothetical protein